MKNRKGFTLIELLAVILILGIIALIAIPTVTTVIKESKKGAFEVTLKQLLKSAEQNCMLEQMRGDEITTEYIFENGEVKPALEVNGSLPKSGNIKVDDKCKAEIQAYDEDLYGRGDLDNIEVKNDFSPICRRATVLHTEICNNEDDIIWDDEGYFMFPPVSTCRSHGYEKGDTITYGNSMITEGVLTAGDAFDCDVNGDGIYDEETERFYYVSDLYDTATKEFDNNYAVLIYYSNTSKGISVDLGEAKYDESGDNWYGPRDAKLELPTIKQWKNVRLVNEKRAILTYENSNTSATGNALPRNFSYEGYSTRLLTYQEAFASCGSEDMENCEYFLENTGYTNRYNKSHGYWLETPEDTCKNIGCTGWRYNAWRIDGEMTSMGLSSNAMHASSETVELHWLGVRPVIEISKSDIEY